jgi:hypothetical protein
LAGGPSDEVWVLSHDGRSLFSGGLPRKIEDGDDVSPREFLAEAARRRAESKPKNSTEAWVQMDEYEDKVIKETGDRARAERSRKPA